MSNLLTHLDSRFDENAYHDTNNFEDPDILYSGDDHTSDTTCTDVGNPQSHPGLPDAPFAYKEIARIRDRLKQRLYDSYWDKTRLTTRKLTRYLKNPHSPLSVVRRIPRRLRYDATLPFYLYDKRFPRRQRWCAPDDELLCRLWFNQLGFARSVHTEDSFCWFMFCEVR